MLKMDMIKSLCKKTQLIPSTPTKIPAKQVARFEFSSPTSFIFHVITQRQKEHLFLMPSVSLRNLILIKQYLYVSKTTVMMFIRFL